MLSRFYRKIGSIVGLLAILMATLAPTISHAIASSRGADDAFDTLCSAQPSAATATGSQPGNQTDDHSLAAHWHACGYCSLLSHVPVLPATPAALALPARQHAQRIASRFESVALVAPFQAAQPRAPPRYL